MKKGFKIKSHAKSRRPQGLSISVLFKRLRCRVETPRHDGIISTGFTLIELLVVVLIIGILAAVALPQYEKAVLKSRLMQYVMYVEAITKSQQLYYLANGKYTKDVRDLDIDITAKGIKFEQGSWTQGEDNVSVYYDGDGTNCGPSSFGGGACVVNMSDKSFFIHTSNNPTEIYCRGYHNLEESICRALAGGAEQVNEQGDYLIHF